MKKNKIGMILIKTPILNLEEEPVDDEDDDDADEVFPLITVIYSDTQEVKQIYIDPTLDQNEIKRLFIAEFDLTCHITEIKC